MEQPSFTTLHPEGSFNASKDIGERLLMDSMQDGLFILEGMRELDERTRREVRKALGNMTRRSRHVVEHLIDTPRERSLRSSGRSSVGES